MSKPVKNCKLYREAAIFQDYVSFLFNHLVVPNSLDSTQSVARGVCGQFIKHVAEAYILRIRLREGLKRGDPIPFPSKAFDSAASIVANKKKFQQQISARMAKNVWRG